MNIISLGFGLLIFLLSFAMTAFVWWGAGRHSKWSKRKRKFVCGSFLVGGMAFSIFAYQTDSHQRVVTLFEVKFEWGKMPQKSWEIEVEHPESVHRILLQPLVPPFGKPEHPVTLHITLERGDGAPVIDETLVFGITTESSGKSRVRQVWESHDLSFQPANRGLHILRIAAVDRPPPILFIRIEDPMKRDGKRARGY